MNAFIAAAASAILLTACSQAAFDDTSCVERANKGFNKCLSANGDQCTAARLHDVEICDASHMAGRAGAQEIVPTAGSDGDRHPSLRDGAR